MAETGSAAVADRRAFGDLLERHRSELRVHCYRMLGSLEEAEDLVQETFLRAWRGRGTYQGLASPRAWLYRIATNACLDFLDRHPRRPRQSGPDLALDAGDVHWLQPYPDRLLASAASADEPAAAAVGQETIELAFLVAIQHLPPRQRAVLLLRDVLGWRAGEVAALLDTSIDSVKSALRRARATMRARLPARRSEWAPATPPSAQERELLRRFMDAHARTDAVGLARLLRDDARMAMPPYPFAFSGREAIEGFVAHALGPASPLHRGAWRCVPTRANRRPAVAAYVRLPGQATYRAQALDVLRVEDGLIVEIVVFQPHVFGAFGLPDALAE